MSFPTLFVAAAASLLTTMTACAVVDDPSPTLSAPRPAKSEAAESIRVEIGEATLTVFDEQGHPRRVTE